jgi:hypothetical protein
MANIYNNKNNPYCTVFRDIEICTVGNLKTIKGPGIMDRVLCDKMCCAVAKHIT